MSARRSRWHKKSRTKKWKGAELEDALCGLVASGYVAGECPRDDHDDRTWSLMEVAEAMTALQEAGMVARRASTVTPSWDEEEVTLSALDLAASGMQAEVVACSDECSRPVLRFEDPVVAEGLSYMYWLVGYDVPGLFCPEHRRSGATR